MTAEEPTWPVQMPPATVAAWVIEHRDSDPRRPQFFTTGGTPGPYGWGWTTEAREALRFARREDARRVAGAKGMLHARLVERRFPAGG